VRDIRGKGVRRQLGTWGRQTQSDLSVLIHRLDQRFGDLAFIELDASALEPNWLAGSAYAAAHHIDGFGEPGGAGLFSFSFGNPAAVFSTMGEA